LVTLAALGAGLSVYLLSLAVVGYFFGEAPAGLAKVLGQLRGEPEPQRKRFWLVEDGQLSRRQRMGLLVIAAALLGVVGLLFFRSAVMAVLLGCLAPVYPYTVERAMKHKRRELLASQFGIALQAMSASLRAGASLRTAVERAAVDVESMLAGVRYTPIVDELRRIELDMQKGLSLEEALIRFRDRVQLEDVTDFVGAVLLCRVRGGNVAVVMASIAEIIQDKITIRNQILTLTAGKRAEANMVTFGPPAMVILLGFISPDYLEPMYSQLLGQIMLAVGSGLLAVAFVIGRKVLEIEV
jgi:tight adherence protein B